jgi:formylmethanofuran dehydrogenase subunit D
MERIGVEEGETIKVSSRSGEVFVKATKSKQYPHEGTVFMPLGPWANAIIDSDVRCVKGTIEPARDKDVLNAIELIEELYLKPKPFCYLNPKDREKVRVKENEKIRLITPRGDIFAFVKENEKIAEGEAEVRYKTYKIKAKIEGILAKRRTQ